jgi:transposase-like protein
VARDKREWVTSFTPDPVAEVESAAITGRLAETPECARCGSSMHLETASTGNASGQRYWRCDRAPACRGIRPL